ncbi:MAG: response regulator [Rhodothermales bacterium]|nr:response regulator [Rhodothermales bacterium]
MPSRHLSLLFAMILTAAPSAAQDPGVRSLDPELRLSQYIHDIWQTNEGLPQNSVSDIVRTDDGYLWFGTQEGLVRFDGDRFTVFDARSVPEMERSDVVGLAVAPDGYTLWMSTKGAGVLTMRDGVFKPLVLDGIEVPTNVTMISMTPDGSVWLGSIRGGLVQIGPDAVRKFDESNGFTGTYSGAVVQDGGGRMRVGTNTGLMEVTAAGLRPSEFEELREVFVSALYTDPDGALWIATRGSQLFELRPGRLIDHSELISGWDGYVKRIQRDAAGTLWLAHMGAGLLRMRGSELDRIDTSGGLSDDQATSLLADLDGMVWVGTNGGGLNRFRAGLFAPFGVQEGLPHDNTYTVASTPDGTIWIGTEDGLVGTRNQQIVARVGKQEGLSDSHILSVAPAQNGGVWIGTLGGGLYRWDDGIKTHYDTQTGLTGNAIFALMNDHQGRLWIGTDAGVNYLEGGRLASITTDDGLTSPYPTYFAPDGQGVWIATYDGGINYWMDGTIQRTVTVEDGLATNEVLTLMVDTEGRVWAGGLEAGLTIIDGEKTSVLTTDQGLFNDTVMSIHPDDSGRVWISSNKGIFHVLQEEVIAFTRGDIESVQSEAFDVRDGLRVNEANGGQQPAAWRAEDGKLWYPTSTGAVAIDPAVLDHSVPQPRVLVEALRVDGNELSLADAPLDLGAGSDRLQFRFTATELADPSRVEFRYRVAGHRDEWIAAESGREAIYSNLGPGVYTFEVTGGLTRSSAESRVASVSFEIAPFFWQTTWFLVLCGFGTIGLIVGFFQMRIRHHQAKAAELERIVDERTFELREEKERVEEAKEVIEAQALKLQELDRFKTRFFANVSHEFRTPLTMIIGPLENALGGRYGQVEGRVRRQMDIMLRNALRLMRLINQLLDLSKLEAGKMQLRAGARNIVGFLNDVMLTIAPFAEKKGLELKVTSEADRVEVYYEPDKLEKVFYNLLSNAAKFTPTGGTLSIDVTTQAPDDIWPEGSVLVKVADTGRGIPADALPTIFDRFQQVDGSNTRQHEGTGIGLSLVKEMVTLHGGTVEVESVVGEGTTFNITFPAGCAHLEEDQVVQTGTLEFETPALSTYAASEFGGDSASNVPVEDNQPTEAPDDAPLVLVVDDNQDVRDYVGSIISPVYRVVYAVDGVDGLEKARSESPDLILSDVMMPRMDGNELVKRLKADEDLKIIPIILVSARATQQVKMEGLLVGADDYVPKPFNAEELLARIENLLKLRQHQKQLKALNENLEDKVEEQLKLILTERERYEAELIEERDRAEAASRMKSAILDNMNHEFRTPLSIILGASQVLADEVPDELSDFSRDIQGGATRLQNTLESVCEISMLTAGLDAALTTIDPSDSVRRTVDAARESAEAKGLSIHAKVQADFPRYLETDEACFTRIVDILVDNAVKFTDSGDVIAELSATPSHLEVRVRDTGIGIEKDKLDHIFEVFTQASEGLHRSHEGSGLGLAIAAKRAEAIGAELTANSEPGKGSVFTLRVPRADAPEVSEQKKTAGEAGEGTT